jgi:hypothetical protein
MSSATSTGTASNTAAANAAVVDPANATFNAAEWLQKVQDACTALTTITALKNPGSLLFTAVQNYGDTLVSAPIASLF